MSAKSTKAPLHSHIDGLCEELGITEKPYSDKNTVEELQAIIDELEAKLPDEGDGDDGEGDGDESNELLIGTMALPGSPNGTIVEKGIDVPAIKTNSLGDVLIEAICTIQLISHGNAMVLNKHQREYVDEKAAMAAVDEGVAYLVAE